MLDGERSRKISMGEGTGIADLLYRQLRKILKVTVLKHARYKTNPADSSHLVSFLLVDSILELQEVLRRWGWERRR